MAFYEHYNKFQWILSFRCIVTQPLASQSLRQAYIWRVVSLTFMVCKFIPSNWSYFRFVSEYKPSNARARQYLLVRHRALFSISGLRRLLCRFIWAESPRKRFAIAMEDMGLGLRGCLFVLNKLKKKFKTAKRFRECQWFDCHNNVWYVREFPFADPPEEQENMAKRVTEVEWTKT